MTRNSSATGVERVLDPNNLVPRGVATLRIYDASTKKVLFKTPVRWHLEMDTFGISDFRYVWEGKDPNWIPSDYHTVTWDLTHQDGRVILTGAPALSVSPGTVVTLALRRIG